MIDLLKEKVKVLELQNDDFKTRLKTVETQQKEFLELKNNLKGILWLGKLLGASGIFVLIKTLLEKLGGGV